MRRAALMFGALLAMAPGSLFSQPQFKSSFELRLRWEGFDTPVSTAQQDEGYDFGAVRLRVGGDLKWERVTLHGVLQGAGSAGLPENAAFGAGQSYVAANDGDTEPEQVGVAELSAALRAGSFQLVLGRQPWNDGLETMTGVEYLDGIKRRRIGDRLIGTWDWPNVGRRYDGLSFGGTLGDSTHLSGFAFRPLAGGVNYKDALEELEDLTVFGLSVTGKYGAWIPGSELRLFAIQYDDERRGALQAAGGELGITTLGGHFLAGNARNDLVLWGAFQGGDWGRVDQEGWAFIVEAGHEFKEDAVKLGLRVGAALASGDDPSTPEHEGFYNLLPTNHKFYGGMDYLAFSNLQTVYAELLLSRGPRWNLRLGADLFELNELGDAMYVGSGPFDEARLGYTLRRPVGGGGFRERRLGTEIDLDLNVSLRKDLRLSVGGGLFSGGAAMAQTFPEDQDGTWVYTQLAWTR